KKVSRRKGETIGGRYRRNGYVLGQQEPGRLSAPQIRSNKKPVEFTSTGFSFQRQADQKSSNRHTS
ncbi:MAG: hypothetical protein ACRES0_22220, partial [Pseudomonas sp.]